MRPGLWVRGAVLTVLAMVIMTASANAQEYRYVSDRLQVTVRTGTTTGNAILFLVNSGTRLEILEENNEGWTKVRGSDGREGWMLSRYLQKEKTAALRLKELDPQTNNLAKKVELLNAENQDLRESLRQSEAQTKSLEERYQKMKDQSEAHQSLKEEHQQLKADFEAQQKKLDEVSAETESMKFGNNLKWFLAGAGVLVLGWLMGLAFAKRKKRASSLY
jgi:SH3 domain protein